MNQLSKLLRLEIGIIVVLLLGCIFGPDFMNIKVGPIPITMDRLAWGGVMVYFLIQLISHRLPKVSTHWADLLFAIFLGYLVFNIATSNWKYNKFQPVAQWLFFYLIPAGLYLVARYLPQREALARFFTVSMMGMGIYLAIIAVLEVTNLHALIFPRFIVNSPMQEFLGRGRGPFLNPIACGIVQTISMACGLVWWNQVDKRMKLGLIAFSGLMLLGIFCSLTRSVWLSAGIVTLSFVWFYCPKKLQAAMVMTIPLAGFLFFTVGKDKLNSFKRDKEVTAAEMAESIQLRPLLAVIARRMIEDKPFFGHGFRQYQETKKVYHYRDASNLPVQKVLPFVQHNVFLAYGVDIGLFGLSLYISLLGIWVWLATRIMFSQRVPIYAKQSAAVLLVLLTCIVVNGMFHDVAVIPMLNHFVFCLAGWTVGLYQYFLVQKEDFYLVASESESQSIQSFAPNVVSNSVPSDVAEPTCVVQQQMEREINPETEEENRTETEMPSRKSSNADEKVASLSFHELIDNAMTSEETESLFATRSSEKDGSPSDSSNNTPQELRSVFRLENVLKELKGEDEPEEQIQALSSVVQVQRPPIRAAVSSVSPTVEEYNSPEEPKDLSQKDECQEKEFNLDRFQWPKNPGLDL